MLTNSVFHVIPGHLLRKKSTRLSNRGFALVLEVSCLLHFSERRLGFKCICFGHNNFCCHNVVQVTVITGMYIKVKLEGYSISLLLNVVLFIIL